MNKNLIKYFKFSTFLHFYFFIKLIVQVITSKNILHLISVQNISIYPELNNLNSIYTIDQVELVIFTNPLVRLFLITNIIVLISLRLINKDKLLSVDYFLLVNLPYYIITYIVLQDNLIYIFFIYFLMEKLNKKKLVFLFSVFYFYLVYKLFTFNEFTNSHAWSDLIINYSGGFVRRGLLGDIFIKLHLQNYIYLFSVLAILVFLLLFFFQQYQYKKETFLLLFVNPLSISFLIKNFYALIGRKEIFIFLFLYILIFFINKKYFMSFLTQLFIILLLTSINLTYELVTFLIPLMLIKSVNLLNITFDNFKKYSILIIGYVLNFFIGLAMLTVFSNVENFNILCTNLKYNYSSANWDICSGAPRYLDVTKSTYTLEVSNNLDMSQYLYWLVLTLFLLSVVYLVFEKNDFLLLLATLLIFLPMFYFAQDWGRWLYIIFFSITILGKVETIIGNQYIKLMSFISLIYYLYFQHFHCLCENVEIKFGFGLFN